MLMRFFSLLCLLPLCLPACAADAAMILDTAEQHIRLQTKNLSGKATITMGQLDASKLPPCSALEAFTPQGSKIVGRTHIGVRCLSPNSWSVLVPAQIAVAGNYVTTSRPLIAGQLIGESDLVILSGDVSHLPAGVASDPSGVVGKTLRNSLGAGQTIRFDQLVAPIVIRQGQTVRVISKGSGFSVSAEGKAVNNAALGQPTQIRMNSGQTITGTARADGSVEIEY
ncbi:MAG: flagellar basal body P-ring formation protein FlgA [Azonexus sp.]|nr:flagellar basal body P-ring formation protein FlgA [Azonexus sp.]MBP6202561.1 flagellar basal body P-ring formation protein FlgA [Azonexus sp.]